MKRILLLTTGGTIASRLTDEGLAPGLDGENLPFRVFQSLRTCGLVVVGRYFSRADSLMQALRMLKRTVFHFGWGSLGAETFLSFGLTGADWLRLGLAGGTLLAVELLLEKGVDAAMAGFNG